MHRDILGKFHYNTLSEWQQAMKAMPREAYGRLEWQANAFAGHLLMPTDELRSSFAAILAKITAHPRVDPNDDSVRELIEKQLADIFGTSSMTAHIRLEREGL